MELDGIDHIMDVKVHTHTVLSVCFEAAAAQNISLHLSFSSLLHFLTLALLMLEGSRLHRSDSLHLFDPNTHRLLSDTAARLC